MHCSYVEKIDCALYKVSSNIESHLLEVKTGNGVRHGQTSESQIAQCCKSNNMKQCSFAFHLNHFQLSYIQN